MKSSKFYIFLPLLITIMLCIPSLICAKAEEKIEKTYSLDRDGKVYVRNISGDIVVNSWEKNEIKIIALKVARYERDLDNVTIDIHQTNGNVRIITRHYKSFSLFRSKHVSVYLELFIPDKAHLRVKNISGSIEAREIGGFIDIKTISGDIKIGTAKNGVKCQTVSGEIKIGTAQNGVKGKTISGDISLEAITGNADLKTISGEITVEGLKGSFKADTVSGDIELETFSHAEEIEAESISGSIELYGELSPGGIYEVDSHSGTIKIGIPAESDFELQTKTFSGDIQCDFELTMSGKINRKKLQGVVGKGGTSLIISSFSGNIRITKR